MLDVDCSILSKSKAAGNVEWRTGMGFWKISSIGLDFELFLGAVSVGEDVEGSPSISSISSRSSGTGRRLEVLLAFFLGV